METTAREPRTSRTSDLNDEIEQLERELLMHMRKVTEIEERLANLRQKQGETNEHHQSDAPQDNRDH